MYDRKEASKIKDFVEQEDRPIFALGETDVFRNSEKMTYYYKNEEMRDKHIIELTQGGWAAFDLRPTILYNDISSSNDNRVIVIATTFVRKLEG